MRPRIPLSLLIVSLVVLCGCGGGGGGGTPAPTSTAVSFNIAWAARTRNLNAPASALSAVLTLKQAATNGGDFRFVINRAAAPASYVQSYTSTDRALSGTWDFEARFYSQADGGGDVVAIAADRVTLRTDGTGVDTVATTSAITGLELIAGQTVKVGERKSLLFVARNADNAAVALSPGSASFTIPDGADRLHAVEDQVEGVAEGTARVVVSVDGHVSAPTAVTVVPAVTLVLTPLQAAVPVGAAQSFSCAVTGAANTAVTWSIDENASATLYSPGSGGTITQDGLYTAPWAVGTFHVTATSQADPTKHVTAAVTVQPGIQLTPTARTVNIRESIYTRYTMIGFNAPLPYIVWSVQEGAAGGTITTDGVYTAPDTAGIYHVVATSNRAPYEQAIATITVQSGDVSVIVH